MSIEEVKQRIQSIIDNQRDSETAHYIESTLREDVLKAIANGVDNPQELAQLTLTTKELKFPRWYS
jgi:septum formation topological specificity factor MinE